MRVYNVRLFLMKDERDILYCSCQEGKRKKSSFIKTASYKTVLILGTLFPLNSFADSGVGGSGLFSWHHDSMFPGSGDRNIGQGRWERPFRLQF